MKFYCLFIAFMSPFLAFSQSSATCECGSLSDSLQKNCIRLLADEIDKRSLRNYINDNWSIGNKNKMIEKMDSSYQVFVDKGRLIEAITNEPNYGSDSLNSTQRYYYQKAHFGTDNSLYELIKKLRCIMRITDNNIPETKIVNNLLFISSVEVLQLLHYSLEADLSTRNQILLFPQIIKRNLQLIDQRFHQVIEDEFELYTHVADKPRLLKGIYISSPNDVLFPVKNLDRDFTGGARLELMTDYLNFRFKPIWALNRAADAKLRSPNLKKESKRGFWCTTKFLSGLLSTDDDFYDYQSVTWGFELYTPNLRDASVFNTPYSYDVEDRPYASFQWYGLAKYKIDSRGAWRLRRELRLGQVGGNIAKIFQTVVHQDLTIGSRNPFGWEAQIANGGRFAIQWDIDADFMILSKGAAMLKPDGYKNMPKKVNVFIPLKGHIGAHLTGADIGIGYSLRNFKSISGNNDIPKLFGGKINFNVMASVSTRYQHHNSMLEGFGYFNTKPDEEFPDITRISNVISQDVPTEEEIIQASGSGVDLYILGQEQINRWLLLVNVDIYMRAGNTTFGYRYGGISREYDFTGAKSKAWHDWGRLSLSYQF